MAKTKTLISFAVTGGLICVLVFAYAKIRLSHIAAQIIPSNARQFLYFIRNPFIFYFIMVWAVCVCVGGGGSNGLSARSGVQAPIDVLMKNKLFNIWTPTRFFF